MRLRTFRIFLACLSFMVLCGCGLFVQKLPNGKVPDPRPHDHFVEINGIRYHYTEYPGPGRDIFLLHGFASSTYTWEKVAPMLQGKGYHVWALDMKGFGWSDKPKEGVYSPMQLMEEVNQWMEVMGLHHVVFAGNSLGGAIAWNMAVEHPDKVSELILVDAAGFLHERPLPVRLAGLSGAATFAELFFGRFMVKETLKDVYYDSALITNEQVDAYYDRLRTENALYAMIRLSRSLDGLMGEDNTDRISGIRLRTLIIWGKEDSWIPLDDALKFKAVLPDAILKIIPSCGHIPQEEKPEETARLIIDFLRPCSTFSRESNLPP